MSGVPPSLMLAKTSWRTIRCSMIARSPLPLQRIQPGENGRNVIAEVGQRVVLAAGGEEVPAIVAGDDDDPPARAAGSRLDDELRPIAGEFEEPPHVAVALDQGICLRHGDPRRPAEALGEVLLIDPRIKAAGVEGQDEMPVAAIDADDARDLQLAGPGPESPGRRLRHAAIPSDVPAAGPGRGSGPVRSGGSPCSVPSRPGPRP